jgi:hypothetical protein
MSQQLMADIAASLQLAAAATPAPPTAPAKPSGRVSAHHMNATAASSPAAAQPTEVAASAKQQDAPAPTKNLNAHAQQMPSVPEHLGIQSSSKDFLACLEESAAASKALSDCTAGKGLASNDSGCSALLHDGLHALLGQQAAAAVLAAAEAAAGSACGAWPGAMPHYTSLAATMPVSIKVRQRLTKDS